MADPRSLADSSTLSSFVHPTGAARSNSGAHTGREYPAGPSGLSSANVGEERISEEQTVWYSAIPDIPPPQCSSYQTNQLPTPRSYDADNALPFFPTAVASPESPLVNARLRLLGGIPNSAPGTAPARSQARPDPYTDTEHRRLNKSATQPQAITPRASPMSSPESLPPRPLSLSLLSSSSREPPGVFVKAESPPPMLAPPHDVSSSRVSTQATEVSLSSPFVEKSAPSLGATRQRHPFDFRPTDSPTPSSSRPARPLVLSSPAHIEDRGSLPIQITGNAELPTEELSRRPGGELNRIRNHMMEVEETRRAELESRRPDYLKRLHPGEEPGASSAQGSLDGTADKNTVGIMETPARGRRIQLFDFQETSAESFEESLMKHGYGTYGEPRTLHTSLAATEGLSKEAYDWLVNNTPAAVPGAAQSQLVPDAELNEKELKKRKRLEAFRGSTARALSSKLYPTELEPFGRVLMNMTPLELEELNAPPAKKRATGRRKRGGAAAAERKGKALRGSTSVRTECTQPRWLDKELPWCLREREREKEQKARDEERIKWIESYFAHDTADEDSDKNEDNSPPIWDQEEAEDPSDVPAPGRSKADPLQANPNRAEPASEGRKSRGLYLPTDPADARSALMSKRNVRILAQKKLRASGQRHASLRGYREGRLACICGAKEDDGTQAVQCDDCYDWYHLECMGVRDVVELGDRDDPWFCPTCSEKADAAMSAADWRNQRQPTFVPTDERPAHTSARKDVAFYSSSPLRDWGSSGSLATPVQGQGRLHGASDAGEPFRRLIWDDSHPGPHPSSPRVVQVHTPGGNHGFDLMSSPRASLPRVTSTSFTTPKNNASGGTMGSGFGLPWPPPAGLFATPTPSGRGGSAYGFGGHDSSSSRVNAMYETDDTPIRRASVKDSSTHMVAAHHPSLDSPLSGRGLQKRAAASASSRAERS